LPFGGINIVFAGDFAQLPPVVGHSLFSGNIGTQLDSAPTVADQEAAIGKALWHQITTVVILKQNMRQKTQSPEDAALRTALVNVRYGKCTPDDIKFLRSLQAGKRPDIASLPLTMTCTATTSQQPHLPIASAPQHASRS